MKYLIKKNEDRIHKQDNWKTSAYAFVPYQTHFGELCGFADDVVAGGKGFGMHPHQNMEISTIVLKGSQQHKDNTGSEGTLSANAVQTMSAGKGIMHSEFNASATESFSSYQIWIYPKQQQVDPRYEQFSYAPADKLNHILLALSPDRRNNSALINQDAFLSVLRLEKGKEINYPLYVNGHGVYIHTAEGKVLVEQQPLVSGDAIGVYEINSIALKAEEDTELIFIEVPMTRGIAF